MKNVESLMKERLQKDLMTLLESIARIADREKVCVYVVGGFVRDLLLNIDNLDLDIAVEGDGIGFAEVLAQELQGQAKSYQKFGTAVIALENGLRVDVAMARTESYPRPGALPEVERSSIKSDLFRRDFSINSLAVKLNGKEAFCLLDYFNGERDLKDRVIRVLHDQSFVDDPCRIFRAIRFEQRFGFRIDRQTEALMKSAIEQNRIDPLSGTRLLKELTLLLQEPDPVRCIDRLRDLSLLQSFAPDIPLDDAHREILEQVGHVLVWAKTVPMPKEPETWLVYFLGLFISSKDAVFEKVVERLHLPARIRNQLRSDREHFIRAKCVLAEGRELVPSEIYDIFSELSSEAAILLLAVCSSEQANKYATLFFTQYHSLAQTALTGGDLIRMGMEPGPVFETVLKTLRDARVNGQVRSREEEVSLVESQFLK